MEQIDFSTINPNKQEIKKFIKEKIQSINLKGIRKHIKSKYWNKYIDIIKLTEYLGTDETINFNERLYHIMYDLKNKPICPKIIPSCTGILKFKNFNDGYQQYCEKCYCKSPEWSKMNSDIYHNRNKEDELNRRKKISDSKLKHTNEIKEKIKQKKKETLFKNFGSLGLSHPSITNKKIQTHKKKRGVDWATQTNEVQEKRKLTEYNRYDGKRWMETDKAKERFNKVWKEKMKKYVSNLVKSRNLELLSDYDGAHNNIILKCLKCQNTFTILWNSFQQGGGVCPTCFPQHTGTSYQENEIANFIKSLNFNIIKNDRKLISPYELDILIPVKKIAIEYCGLWCHSSGGYIPDKFIVPKNYHIMKLNMCNKVGYRLITIFEDEWINSPDIVKSRLKYILNVATFKSVRGSKCIVKEIDNNNKKEFLEKYHLQGNDNSAIKLGLFYNEQLISVMTFSKPSIAKGNNKIQNQNKWELNRFCNNPNFHIHGGAQKLLKYFCNNYQWNTIISFADKRWSDGNLYNKLGFKRVIIKTKSNNIINEQPNYWYWGKGIISRKHRYNYTKSSLKNSKYYSDDLTEKEIMTLEKRSWIYDCGNFKFELTNTI